MEHTEGRAGEGSGRDEEDTGRVGGDEGRDESRPYNDQGRDGATATCPECGASYVDGMTCWEQLGGIIAWEYADPDLQAEHFLTVASYNLQHPAQFTDEAIAGLQLSLSQRLDHRITDAEIRQRSARAYEGSKRVKRPTAEQHPVLRHWTQTIADVYLPDQPADAADRVRAWAAAIRRDLES